MYARLRRGFTTNQTGEWPDPADEIIENRYFEEPVHGVRLYYFQVLWSHPFRQHDLDLLNVTCNGAFAARYASAGSFARRAAPCRQAWCVPGSCKARRVADAAPGEFLQYSTSKTPPAGALGPLVRALLPSDVVVNAGLHWRQGWNESGFTTVEVARLLRDEAAELSRGGAAVRLHWRTTTAVRNRGWYEGGPAEYAFADGLLESAGFEGVFDAWILTDALRLALEANGALEEGYWDAAHFHGPVYAQLNRIFIAYLCSLPPAPRLAGPEARRRASRFGKDGRDSRTGAIEAEATTSCSSNSYTATCVRTRGL